MKTRVIQDDPDEPTTREEPAAAPAGQTRSTNFAGRMGRWSARHRKIAIFGWLGLVVVAVLIGKTAGTIELKQNDAIPGESGRATRLIEAEFGPRASETVLVQSTTLTADDPAFRAAVGDVLHSIESFTVVGNVDSPYARNNSAQISQYLGAGRGRGRSRAEGASRTDDRRVR